MSFSRTGRDRRQDEDDRTKTEVDTRLQGKHLSTKSWLTFPLHSRARSAIFLIAVGVPGLLLAYRTIEIAVAATIGESSRPAELREASKLDPANPELHYRLGLGYFYSFDHSQPEEGLSELRQATKLIPTRPAYWSGLASACESFGDRACADFATERTLQLAPMAPRTWWDAANHDVVEGHSNKALAEFRRLLELDPGYAPATFRVCLRIVADPWMVYQRILADQKNPRLNFAFINYLTAHDQGEKAYHVWEATLAMDQHFPFSLAEPYLDWLLRHGPNQEAVSAWHDLIFRGIIRKSPEDSAHNLVFNSGFERHALNAGFGWHTRQESFTRVRFDDSDAYQGRQCLKVDFTVRQNEDYEPAYEIVPVTPDHTYLLQAYVRSDGISSDCGPRLRVVDPDCSSCLDASTTGTVGTTGWHRVSMRVSTSPATRLLKIAVWRPLCQTYPTEISGTFWLDAVSLEITTSVNKKPKETFSHSS